MSLHRFFATGPLSPTGPLPLTDADRHHLRDVLRLGPGAEIVVVAEGRAMRVLLTAVEPELCGEVLGDLAVPRLPRVTLVQGIAKGEKMDVVVRQTTELGVARIVPLLAERSVVRLDADKAAARASRWRRIAAEAAKQSQRVDVPTVRTPVGIDGLGPLLAASVVLICQEQEPDAPGIAEVIRAFAPVSDTDVAVVVGPEGGLTPTEVAMLEGSGGRRVSMGPTVLRTETAGVVAVALALHAGGGLGAERA